MDDIFGMKMEILGTSYSKGETYFVSAIPNAVTYFCLFLRDFTLLRETALWEFVRTRGTKRCLKAQQQIGRFFNENDLFSNKFLKELFRHKCTYCGGDIEDVFSTVKGIFWYSVDFQHREGGGDFSRFRYYFLIKCRVFWSNYASFIKTRNLEK